MGPKADIFDAPHRGFTFGAFTLDVDQAALFHHGEAVKLRRQSYDVLQYLVERHGRLVEKENLLKAVWGNKAVTDDSLTHCLIDIRKVIGDASREMIRTVPRRGFIFDLPVKALARSSSRRRELVRGAQFAAILLLGLGTGYLLVDEPDKEPVPVIDSAAKSAYDRYVQGRFMFNRRAPGDLAAACDSFREAIDIEPTYAKAWAGLAGVYSMMIGKGENREAEIYDKLKEAAEKAVELDPGLAAGWIRLSGYYNLIGDTPSAKRYFERAIAADPDDPLTLAVAAGRAAAIGDITRAVELQQWAVQGDPLSFIYRGNLAIYLLASGRYEEALQEHQRAVQLRPEPAGRPDPVAGFALIKLRQFRRALDVIDNWPSGPEKDAVMAMAHFSLGHDRAADNATNRLLSRSSINAFLRMAELEAFCDNIDRSFARLQQMRDQLWSEAEPFEVAMQSIELRVSPFLAPLRSDPRWEQWFAERHLLSATETCRGDNCGPMLVYH